MPAELIPLDKALERLLQAVHPIRETETLDLIAATGRVLARDIISPINVPAFDNSRMDGYALATRHSRPRMEISQEIAAGSMPQPLRPGTAARIFTGAPMPEGADTVVIQEQTTREGCEVVINAPIRPGRNIGRAGEDIARGSTVLAAGRRLLPQDLGLIASVGVARVEVFRRLKVAIFSTGDELQEPGTPLPPGALYNSNRYVLTGLLQRLGCEIMDLGIVRDDLEATVTTLMRAGREADMVITSGGVSVGEHDHLRQALQRVGKIHMWRLAVKPGKPLLFGEIAAAQGQAPSAPPCPYLGLPGNPVSVFATFCVLARPFLLARAGADKASLSPPFFRVTAGFTRNKPARRREFLRCRLETDANGAPVAIPYANQSSAVLVSVSRADGLCVVREGATVAPGEPLDFLPFTGLLC